MSITLRQSEDSDRRLPTNAEPNPLMRPSEVAEMFRVSRTWVYSAAADGRIPSVRLGGPEGPLRFVRADVEQWLDEARSTWCPGQRGR